MVGSDHHPIIAYIEYKIPKIRGQFRFNKGWIGKEGLMESIAIGLSEYNEGCTEDIVTKISNCRHEIAKWRKNNPPYGKEKNSDLQKALKEVQTDNNRSQDDILEVSKKLLDAYKDEKDY